MTWMKERKNVLNHADPKQMGGGREHEDDDNDESITSSHVKYITARHTTLFYSHSVRKNTKELSLLFLLVFQTSSGIIVYNDITVGSLQTQ